MHCEQGVQQSWIYFFPTFKALRAGWNKVGFHVMSGYGLKMEMFTNKEPYCYIHCLIIVMLFFNVISLVMLFLTEYLCTHLNVLPLRFSRSIRDFPCLVDFLLAPLLFGVHISSLLRNWVGEKFREGYGDTLYMDCIWRLIYLKHSTWTWCKNEPNRVEWMKFFFFEMKELPSPNIDLHYMGVSLPECCMHVWFSYPW